MGADASAGTGGALIGYRYRITSTGSVLSTELHRTTDAGTHGYLITSTRASGTDTAVEVVVLTDTVDPICALPPLLAQPLGYYKLPRNNKRRHTQKPPRNLTRFLLDQRWQQFTKDEQYELRHRYDVWKLSLSSMELAAERRNAAAAIAATAATAVTPAAATIAATTVTAATQTVLANPASRQEKWDNRLADLKQMYHAAGNCENQEMTSGQEAAMIRQGLQVLDLCPLNGFELLEWGSHLLPRLFRVLAWQHQPSDAQPFKVPPDLGGRHSQLQEMLDRLDPGMPAVAPEDMEEAVRLVELHLLQLAYDAMEPGANSNCQQGSPSGLALLDQVREMLLSEVTTRVEDNPDLTDATFLGERRLYTRGGRPVVADPAKDYTGHSLGFVKATLKRAGPVLGLDGLQPRPDSGDPLSAACELEEMIVDKPRGFMLRQIPGRLHREFAHTYELILHCFEQVHTSWTEKRDDPALSKRTHAMFIALLFFPTLVLTINTKSAETPMSQVKNNLGHFLRGNWYAPVHTYMSLAERSSTTHARQDEPAMRLGSQGSDLMRQAAKMAPAARQCLRDGKPAKCVQLLLSQGKFEGTDGDRQLGVLHPKQVTDENAGIGDLAGVDDDFTVGLEPWVANPIYGSAARDSTRAYFEEHIDLQKISLSIKKARSHTSPGIGGGTFDMFKILVYEQDRRKKQDKASVDTILQRLHYLALSLLSADLPAGCEASLRRNILLGLKKKNSDVPRPIGIGDLLRRFTGRLASEVIKEPLRQLVGLWQQGSSTPSGSDVVASVARCFHQLRPSKMISVRTDVKNAFNSGDRRWIIRVLETYFPEFGPLVRALYEGPTDLVYTDPSQTVHHVEGQKGVTQGCPLASHLFNLALHAIDERVMPKFNKVLKMGYCDDSYFTSENIADLKACTDVIADRCKRYAGLTYCQHKYEALAPEARREDMS